jgi:nucleotide-binding universal stress UspA family protein
MITETRCRALVALSRQVHSIYALRLACQLGRLGGLGLDLLHVIENEALPRGAGWAPYSWAREREQEARQELGQMVQAEQEFCDVGGGVAFAHGRAEEELLQRLRGGRYDLVILGGHPSGHPGTLLGHLAKESPVPVIVARGARPLRRVLLATDGGAEAENTLRLMGRLLGESSVEATLFSLNGPGAVSRGRELLRAEGVETSTVAATEPGWQGLLAETARGGYDLLVVAQAPSGGRLRDLLSGGQPELRLALHAPCPVMMPARG